MTHKNRKQIGMIGILHNLLSCSQKCDSTWRVTEITNPSRAYLLATRIRVIHVPTLDPRFQS